MADLVRYVNLTTSASGNGETNGEGSGGTNAYMDLAAWNTAEATDLTDAGGDTMTVHCDRGSGANNPDTAQVVLSGWTTGATNTVTIKGNRPTGSHETSDNGFNDTGIWDATTYYTRAPGVSYGLNIQDSYVTVDGIQFDADTTSTQRRETGSGGGTISNITIRNCWFKKTSTGQNSYAIQFIGTNVTECQIENCIFSDFDSSFDNNRGISTNSPIRIYNCTFHNCDEAIELTSNIGGSEVVRVKNCAIFNGAADLDDSSTSTDVVFDYNATDDPASGTGDPRGTNGQDLDDDAAGEWSAAFTLYTSDDFTVKDASSLLYENGISNGDDSNVPTTDYLGNARETAASSRCEIGAFEFVSAGTTHEEAMSLGYSHTTATGVVATLECASSFGLSHAAAVAAQLAAESGVSLGIGHSATSAAQMDAVSDLAFGVGHGATATVTAVFEAGAAYSVTHAITASGGLDLSDAISLAIGAGFADSAEITIEGGFSLGLGASLTASTLATFDASVSLGAVITTVAGVLAEFDAIAALGLSGGYSVTGGNVTSAGVSYTVTMSLTATGPVTSGSIVTPGGRSLTIDGDGRTLTIRADDRTLTISADTRTLTIQ